MGFLAQNVPHFAGQPPPPPKVAERTEKVAHQPPPANSGDAQQPNTADSQRLAMRPECRHDIRKHCAKIMAQLNPGEVLTDMVSQGVGEGGVIQGHGQDV